MRISFLILCLLPVTGLAQYTLKGVVRDSVTQQPMPGVSVITDTGAEGTVTRANGGFEIQSITPTAQLTFLFIGYLRKTQIVSTSEVAMIGLSYDEAIDEESSHLVKNILHAGYIGDMAYAPAGFTVNYSLQSIGRTSVNSNVNFEYWKEKNNSGLEISLSKDIRIKHVADHFFVSHKSLSYGSEQFTLKQSRAIIAHETRRFFAIDVGFSYNDLVLRNEEGLIRSEYFGGIVGVSKVFSYSSVLKNWGFHANINYHPDRIFFEAGTYKGIYVKKLPAMIWLAKYYNYGAIEGVLVSIRINLFDTRYYCCHSWKIYYHDLDALR